MASTKMAGSTEEPASSTPITRSLFISADHQKIAAANSGMFVSSEDRQGVEEVSTPVSVRESGVIPEGFCVGKVAALSSALPNRDAPHRFRLGP
jgi:hypothetical protein